MTSAREIIFSSCWVWSLPIKTGIVSLPTSLSLWTPRRSDSTERTKTIPKIKAKETAVVSVRGNFSATGGRTAVIAAQAKATVMFFDPGRSLMLRKGQPDGASWAL